MFFTRKRPCKQSQTHAGAKIEGSPYNLFSERYGGGERFSPSASRHPGLPVALLLNLKNSTHERRIEKRFDLINEPMDDDLTIAELEKRWENALVVTKSAVGRHPTAYRELKSLAGDIIRKPLDITDYLPSANKLVDLLETLDPTGRGSIFHLFNRRIAPSDIRAIPWLRMECQDLLAHLKAFDEWRMKTSGLKVVK
jgi:hypothetical protein